MSLQAVREAINTAMLTISNASAMIKMELPLPGWEYEPFILSTGDPVLWKREVTSQGVKVRFKAMGPGQSFIGYHQHTSPEILIAESGILTYDVGGAPRTLGIRETFTAQPHSLHRAEFAGPGEATAQWPDLEGDTIDVAFFPT